MEVEEEPSTPKETKNFKRKQINTPRTPKKEKRASIALKLFTGPYFRTDNGVNSPYYICTICKKERSGNNVANLASHLLYKHEEIYEEYFGLTLLQNCVSIVGLGGRPFASLCDFGFQRIIGNQLEEFSKAGIPLDIKNKNQPAVHTHLKETANQVRDAIKNNVKHQPLSTQLDIATRLGRSIFSINAQHTVNKKLNIANIGMIELKEAHTGKYLSQVYRESPSRHEIIKQQVMSVSGDNGRNVQKFIQIEQHDALHPVARRIDFDTAFITPHSSNERNSAMVDEEIEVILATDEINDEDDSSTILEIFDECGIDLNQTSEHELLLNETIAEISSDHEEVFNMSGVNCAAHTLQLLVKDSLKEMRKASGNVIELCRRVVKALKLNSTKMIIEKARQKASTEVIAKQPNLTLKVPSLDVETRWGSMFTMVSPLACSSFFSLVFI